MTKHTLENGSIDLERLTLNDAAIEYLGSSWFSDLAPATKGQYRRYINILDRRRFNKRLHLFRAKDADELYMEVRDGHTLRISQYFVSVWKVIFRYAEINGWVDRNPWDVIKVKGTPARRTTWTREQVATFVETAANIGDVILAAFIQLLYETAQRPTDILEISEWFPLDNQWYVRIIQNKTGAEVVLPISDWAWALCGCPQPGDRDTLIGTTLGLTGIRPRFNHVKKIVGLPKEVQIRDLRRTALTELGELGSTDDEMQAVSGHTDRNTLNVYSVPTVTKAQNAFNRRFNSE